MSENISWKELLRRLDEMPRWRKKYYHYRRVTINYTKYLYPRIKAQTVHRYQRAKRGFSYQDVWSLDWYLRRVTIDSLRELANQAHGWPGDHHMTFEEYIAMIREIADAFEMELETQENWRPLTAQEELRLDDAWNNFRHWYWSFWD